MKLKPHVFRIVFLIIGVAVVSISAADQKDKSEKKLNILFIAVDDLKPTLGCYGDSLALTPNIDHIAMQGTIMSSNYCQQAVCAPSRISLFTGMRPDYTGVTDLKTFMRDVNPDIVTIPEYLISKGYQTVGRGKLMHGARRNDPRSWTIPYIDNSKLEYSEGFDYPANGRYQSKASHDVFYQAKRDKLNWKSTNDLMKKEGVSPAFEFLDIPDGAYTDGAIADEGIRLLEEFSESDQPFFLALGFQKPHLPFVAPKKYYDLYDDTEFRIHPYQAQALNSPDLAYSSWGELRSYSDIPATGSLPEQQQLELIRAYYSSVSYIDAQIGKVYDKLVELGLDENTIIVIWGDHGWHLGDHGLWCKHTNFEQATHSPLIIAAPGHVKPGISSSMTEFVDIFPTLCDLARIEKPEGLQGRSLVPLLKDPDTIIKKYAVSQFPRGRNVMGYSLRNERFRYTLWIENIERKDNTVTYDIVGKELYDYQTDPMETMSFSGEEEYFDIEKDFSEYMHAFLIGEE